MTSPGQVRNHYPAWRVFWFGFEITEDVTRCAVNYNDGRAPNTCEIELTSKNDKYVITETDIKAMYDDVEGLDDLKFTDVSTVVADAFDDAARSTSSAVTGNDPGNDAFNQVAASVDARNRDANAALAARSDHIDREIRRRLDESLTQQTLKRDVLIAKVVERQEISDAPVPTGGLVSANSLLDLPALTGQALRYPFQVGDCIAHSNDPIRVFWRDPGNPADWYHMFSGFITDWTDSVDSNNARVVRLRCEDVTRVLRYARVATNPGVFDIRDAATAADAVVRTFFSEGFADITLPEFVYTIIFGSDRAGTTGRLSAGGASGALPAVAPFQYKRVGVTGTSSDTIASDGAGAFNFAASAIVVAGPDGTENSGSELSPELQSRVVRPDGLNEWQALIDHKVQRSDIINMAQADGPARIAADLRMEELTTVDEIIQEIGTHPERYPIDGGRLMMLLPASLGPETNRDLLMRDIASSVATHTTWKTRLALLYDVIGRINFSLYASPKGDLIIEMPLYDFDPGDFGDDAVDLDVLRDKMGEIVYEFDEHEQRGPYAPQFRIPRRDTVSWDRSFSDENIRTQMIVNWSVVPGRTDVGNSADVGQVGAVNLRALWPAFGVRSEVMEPIGIINNQEAALLYGAVKLNMINADARNSHYELVMRVQWVWPNRPIEFAVRSEVATTRACNLSIVWNSGVSCGLDVNYVRGWAGQTIPGRDRPQPVYEPIGGFASSELNYAVRWGLKAELESTKRR